VNRESSGNGSRPDERVVRQRFEERGRDHGHDLDDWLEAERELRDAGGAVGADGSGNSSATVSVHANGCAAAHFEPAPSRARAG
jgi:hypothetical protein